jgi:uncharacterized membrane protein
MPETSQSGLSENTAAAVSYLTFIPAIVFLVMEPYNKSSYVRFHAWQCIFISIIAVVVFFVMDVLMAISARMLGPLVLLVGAFDLMLMATLFFIWAICLVNAVNGKKFKLPLVGALAARQAGI